MGTEGIEAMQYDYRIEEDSWDEVGRRKGGHGEGSMLRDHSQLHITSTEFLSLHWRYLGL